MKKGANMMNLYSTVIACGCRYWVSPMKQLLNYTNFLRFLTHSQNLHLQRRSSSSSSSSSVLYSSCNNVKLPNFSLLTINSLFFTMERFWSGSGINKNKQMVEQLQNYGMILSKKVAGVMETVDRALFVPDGTPTSADTPMEIGYNATISAPHMHASCLQLLEQNLQPGMHDLDVGSGTGYLTACFAIIVGAQGRAIGVEHIPELVASSVKSIEKSAAAPLLKEGSLSIHAGDGREGWPGCAPYDALHVGAAPREIPQPLLNQLKPGSRMVIPIGNIFQDLKVVDKNLDGSVSILSETSVQYVPLTSRDAQLKSY